VDHCTLSGDEAGCLRNKTGSTRLGYAVQLKFLIWRGRFPKMRLELPPDAVEHVAKQVGVAATELGFYDFTSRAAKRHRSELRDLTGWHECTKADLIKLVSQLGGRDLARRTPRGTGAGRAAAADARRPDRAADRGPDRHGHPLRAAPGRGRAVAEVAARLAREEDGPGRLDALVFTDPTEAAAAQGAAAKEDGDSAEDDEDDVESVLSDVKSHPGNVSLNSLLDEISKLKQVRAVGVPEKVFTGIGAGY